MKDLGDARHAADAVLPPRERDESFRSGLTRCVSGGAVPLNRRGCFTGQRRSAIGEDAREAKALIESDSALEVLLGTRPGKILPIVDAGPEFCFCRGGG